MIVVASVSATASWLLYSQNLDTTRMIRVLEKEQAVLLALSFEKTAQAILEEDRLEQGEQGYDYYAAFSDPELLPEEDDTTADDGGYAFDDDEEEEQLRHLDQSWAQPNNLARKLDPLVAQFEALGLRATQLCIYDLQGMLNVNNLLLAGRIDRIAGVEELTNDYFDERENPRGRGDWYAERFRELYSEEEFALEESEVIEFMDNIRDWLDDNDDFRPQGAESSDYGFEEPPYRAADGPIASVQEFYLMKVFKEFPLETSGNYEDVDFELGMDRVLGYLTVLPTDAPNGRRININNAPPAVLATLPYIDSEDAQELYRAVRKEPFKDKENLDAFLKDYIEDDKKRHWYKEYIDIQSRFFAAYIELGIGEGDAQTKTRMRSLFYRESFEPPYKVYVLERHYIGYNPYAMMAAAMQLENCYSRGME